MEPPMATIYGRPYNNADRKQNYEQGEKAEKSLQAKPGNTQILPILSIPLQSHPNLGTQGVKTVLREPQGVYKGYTNSEYCATRYHCYIYTDQASRGIFYPAPPD